MTHTEALRTLRVTYNTMHEFYGTIANRPHDVDGAMIDAEMVIEDPNEWTAGEIVRETERLLSTAEAAGYIHI